MKAPLVSIVINNYNYARFLPVAIESALNQDYERCEVIVVDDGSRDGSVDVIRSYQNRVLPILKENGGQSSALNAGFEVSQGQVVIFLDADDVLYPQAASCVAEAFASQPELARVQYRMAVIDAAGNPTGSYKPTPHTPVPNGDIRREMLSFPFDVAWLPTSGNAFSARVLRELLPIPADYGRINSDYYLVHTAPLLGPVIFIDKVLAGYRIHGGNNFEKPGNQLDMDRLRATIRYDEITFQYIRKLALEAGLSQKNDIPSSNHSVSTLASRVISLKLEPEAHPLPGDRLYPLVALGMSSALGRFDTSPLARWIFLAWFAIMGAAPRGPSRYLAELFLFPEKRTVFTRLLGKLHKRRSPAGGKTPAGNKSSSMYG